MTTPRCRRSIAEILEGMRPRRFPVFLAVVLALPLGLGQLQPARAAAPEKELPTPEELGGPELVTRDGLQLSATFYPSDQGKDAVPVILLHMWKGDRKEYADLALRLQREGHAVLVPDLRGHGQSTGSPFGGQKLDAAKMANEHFYSMPYNDMQTLRKFLVKKNDEEELNLNKLCIVGAEMGAAVATYYAAYDWVTPRREAGRAAASQDVKGLVLISPDWDFRGLPLSKPLGSPAVRGLISMMIVAGGEDSKSFADARRVYNLLKRFHADPDTASIEEKDLFFGQPATKLQGTKMLGVKSLNLEGAIARFIELRLANKQFPWYQRGSDK
ncbi:MAG: alpha/beta fold hydrolase [Planctomycetota bacterium]